MIGEGHREEQRVERALDGAEDEGHQAELRLEVVGAAGGLPDVLGLARSPRTRPCRRARASETSGCGLLDRRSARRSPSARCDQDAVALRRDERRRRRRSPVAGKAQERALGGQVAQHERAVGARGRRSSCRAVERPIAWIAAPCGSNSCAWTSARSSSSSSQAHAEPGRTGRPWRRRRASELPPRTYSTRRDRLRR